MEKYIERDEEEFFKILFLKKYLLGTDGMIAGGCFKNIFNNERLKDIDVFFRNKEDFNNANTKYKNNKEYEKFYENNNVVAYREKSTKVVVELIKKIFGDPEQIVDQFDFSITKFCYYYEVDEDTNGDLFFNYYVIHHPKFFEHLQLKKLVLDDDKLNYPFSTFERSYRYNGYGYKLCRESKGHLINAIRKSEDFTIIDLSMSLYSGLD